MFWDVRKPPISTDEARIEEVLSRGVEEIINREDLKKELLSGKQLRVKLGIDPTSPHLHIGRAVPLLKLRDFQQLGHQVVFIVGDFTAVIGDTSDKESERPMLSHKIIEENKKTYFEQAGKILDLKKAEILYNSKWLEKLTYREIGEHADLFSLTEFIARENIKRRLDTGKRVSLREVLYPLMQGYDSVAVKADVELGGTDQKFNLLAGRTMQSKLGYKPQNILTNPLIEGLDGRKMSSSWGNVIKLTDLSEDMYGKLMSLNDNLVERYFITSTRVSIEEIKTLKDNHPRDMKMRLAREIVTMYHGVEEAERAERVFVSTFQKKEIPKNIQEIVVPLNTRLDEALLKNNLVASKSEFRRLISEGAIVNLENGEKILDPDAKVIHATIKIGKRRFLKIKIA